MVSDGKKSKETLIETGDTLPIKSKCRPLNPTIGAKVKERIDDLENREIIGNFSSTWASLILVVAKEKIP